MLVSMIFLSNYISLYELVSNLGDGTISYLQYANVPSLVLPTTTTTTTLEHGVPSRRERRIGWSGGRCGRQRSLSTDEQRFQATVGHWRHFVSHSLINHRPDHRANARNNNDFCFLCFILPTVGGFRVSCKPIWLKDR